MLTAPSASAVSASQRLHVPESRPRLRSTLPAGLARSEASECLGRAQRMVGVALHGAKVGCVLAVAMAEP